MKYFIGVDVGTGSVRAALVQADGKLLYSASKDIRIWNPKPNFYQQSSEDIWAAVMETVKTVCKDDTISPEDIAGIGFDATCSLVVRDNNCKPLSVCPLGNPECDIIMWMDHRASAEADFINATKHKVLQYTGGAISLEMEPPKLLWLKKNLRESCWEKAGHFFDLCDFLCWRAAGSFTRSNCAVVSKWTYTLDDGGRFDETFFRQIGLEELCENSFEKIGKDIGLQGSACGSGLTEQAASELRLKPGTPVGLGIIDAHCGALGCLGCAPRDSSLATVPLTNKLTLICGTSTCHMKMSEGPIFVPGVWGPYLSTILPGLWTAEGGQSAAGKLIDFVLETHAAYKATMTAAAEKKQHISDYLLDLLQHEARSQGLPSISFLTTDFHMWPDFHGNRSPICDHTLKGMVSGLTLQSDSLSLALLYLATVQALAYGTRHILSALANSGHDTKLLYMCGGLRKNSLFVKCHADITGLPVVIPDEEESVLLGAAILGAAAAGLHPTVQDCMVAMCGEGKVTYPDQTDKKYHERKYQVFLEMHTHQQQYKAIMERQ